MIRERLIDDGSSTLTRVVESNDGRWRVVSHGAPLIEAPSYARDDLLFRPRDDSEAIVPRYTLTAQQGTQYWPQSGRVMASHTSLWDRVIDWFRN